MRLGVHQSSRVIRSVSEVSSEKLVFGHGGHALRSECEGPSAV